MLGSNVYMSDLIGDAYTTWKDCLVILNGGTGSGKSYFVINVLIPYYVNQNKQILYLCNREKLEYQIKPQINHYPPVTVWTYQRLQAKLRKKKNLPKYDLIVSDECHYFWTDAKFNSYRFKLLSIHSVKVIDCPTIINSEVKAACIKIIYRSLSTYGLKHTVNVKNFRNYMFWGHLNHDREPNVSIRIMPF